MPYPSALEISNQVLDVKMLYKFMAFLNLALWYVLVTNAQQPCWVGVGVVAPNHVVLLDNRANYLRDF